jgi:hypothetical protein
MMIERGTPVIVRDAFGVELERIALSGPKRGEDFPIVPVCRPEEWKAAYDEGREPEGVPWPREDVRVVEHEPV